MSWLVKWPEYEPAEYTASSVLPQLTWADPVVGTRNFWPRFNERDGPIERRSQNGLYEVENGRPRNPAGQPAWSAKGFGDIGVPTMLQIPS